MARFVKVFMSTINLDAVARFVTEPGGVVTVEFCGGTEATLSAGEFAALIPYLQLANARVTPSPPTESEADRDRGPDIDDERIWDAMRGES